MNLIMILSPNRFVFMHITAEKVLKHLAAASTVLHHCSFCDLSGGSRSRRDTTFYSTDSRMTVGLRNRLKGIDADVTAHGH